MIYLSEYMNGSKLFVIIVSGNDWFKVQFITLLTSAYKETMRAMPFTYIVADFTESMTEAYRLGNTLLPPMSHT